MQEYEGGTEEGTGEPASCHENEEGGLRGGVRKPGRRVQGKGQQMRGEGAGQALVRCDMRGKAGTCRQETVHLLPPHDCFRCLAVPRGWTDAAGCPSEAKPWWGLAPVPCEGGCEHLLAAATTSSCLLFDARRFSEPLLSWPLRARPPPSSLTLAGCRWLDQGVALQDPRSLLPWHRSPCQPPVAGALLCLLRHKSCLGHAPIWKV